MPSRSISEIREERSQVRARRERITEEMQELHARVGDREMTAGERERWENLERGRTAADEEDQRLHAEWGQALDTYVARHPRSREGPVDDAAARAQQGLRPLAARPRDEIEGRALRAIEGSGLSGPAADRLEQVVRAAPEIDPAGLGARYLAAVAEPAYEEAFWRMVSSPQTAHLEMSPAEHEAVRTVRAAQEARALSVGVDADGGFAVPFQLDPSIVLTSDGSVNPIREIARVETIATNEWRGVTSAGVTVGYAAEGAEAGDDAPTLGQPTVTVERAHTFIPFSFEVGMDWRQLRAEMTRLLQDGKDVLEAEKFHSGAGSGSNEPEGLVAGLAAGSKVDTAAATTFAAADIYALVEDLPARFRPRARWSASLPIVNEIDQFETGNGAKLFPRVGESEPVLLRRRLHEWSEMDSDSGTAAQEILLVGDFAHYLIVDRVGMSVELVPHLFGANRRPTGQRGLYAFWRNSAVVLADEAFRLLVVAAA